MNKMEKDETYYIVKTFDYTARFYDRTLNKKLGMLKQAKIKAAKEDIHLDLRVDQLKIYLLLIIPSTSLPLHGYSTNYHFP